MLHKVCRAYHKGLDEVRAWDYDDYLDALECLGEVPLVDEAFFLSFCKPAEQKPAGIGLGTAAGRKAFLETLEKQGKTSG